MQVQVGRKLALAVSGTAALVLTLPGCASEGEDPQNWAETFCEGVRPQAQKIRAASQAIAEASEDDRPAAAVQEADSAAFQDISEAYGALAGHLEDAGEPPIEDGAQVHESAVARLRGVSESYAELKGAVDELDPSDQGEFAEGLSSLANRLGEVAETGDEALLDLQNSEIGDVIAQQQGCGGSRPPANDGEGADTGA